MKAYLVGRHNIPFPAEAGIELVGREAVTFPDTAAECGPVLEEVAGRAVAAGAEWLLFVGMPSQVVAALSPWPRGDDGEPMRWREARRETPGGLRLGLIVSKPGPRPAAVVTRVEVPAADGYWGSAAEDGVLAAVKATNPNAKIEVERGGPNDPITVIITCDPPMRFEFSHIEEM